ncbi:hypothetical protein VOLCADRAFT_115699 [Volvox carteri f. nagariensis]|uniref:Non-canonical E2 ubiquitin-conjugating enzyme C-terminal domain-containing protein n=1 Tax=Volvox carteri f. nagariensis TaxID=3068 RepID=D8THT3_VOLCA|nr:uncharacterized protein VOLCADRAFT_115699 [Volvox carteri f. nagariensis]EFJ53122.1 hypothetical protein VOLCADRAFT_115699 [Volvox carteri f. nagariensis]|eukprot:XP_002946127.1 hypothetical protein VOLCADRAFT_115699 [Volvox carteri f. nagariensis]
MFKLFGSLFRAATFCAAQNQRSGMNSAKLGAVLDEKNEQEPQAAANGTDAGASSYEEHIARLKAEAEAQDCANRLRVAQEQLAEYAAQKEEDSAGLVQEAERLKEALAQLLQQPGSTAADFQQIAHMFNSLLEKLADAATEARAFAAQQASDLATLKRSSAQADLHNDVDMKRVRDGSASSSEASGETAPEEEDDSAEPMRGTISSQSAGMPSTSFAERARYIPLRLSHDERKLLRLLESALNVSEYTDKDLCAILSGLLVATDYRKGQDLIRDRNFADNAEFFQDIFELGRRYKILNPDKMRSEYGKLMYLLMDSAEPAIQELLEFQCVRKLRTVSSFLEERGGLAMLDDPLMHTATAEIVAGERPRHEVQRDIKIKEKAREALSRRYRTARLSEEEILLCIYSISDNNSYLLFNRDPIDRFIHFFHRYFKSDTHEPGYSLAIQGGRDGARLTHNHERQYHYVLQSLTLWREISTEMFKLWYLAESDMLREGNSYRLCDTGQGLNRVQSAPQVGRSMQQILSRVQSRIGSWVGSSVVHLGDHNVPNALMFIDKYTQVPRILNPVVSVLEEIPKLYRDPHLRMYIDATFGGVEQCRKAILVDFCRHAFDGSGADNFFDAGSCIDGRLTSAWNWCSKIEKKPFYHVFKLAGWVGFDGEVKT